MTKVVRVVVGAFEMWPGVFLVAKRPPNVAEPGLIEFPGGKLEEGESERECLEREWKEELNVVPIADIFVTHHFLLHPESRELETEVICYRVTNVVGCPKPMIGQQLLLCSLDGISRLVETGACLPSTKTIVDALTRWKSGESLPDREVYKPFDDEFWGT